MKYIYFAIITLTIYQILTTPVLAAKKRIRTPKYTTAKSTLSYSSAKLNRASNSIILTLTNLDKVQKVNYELTYLSNNIPQGAIGSVSPTTNTDSRDLYFGTCSKGVCTAHKNIQNAYLIVTIKTKSNATNIKKYKIKI